MKLVCPVLALALAAAADAFRIESSDIAPPEDILGEHQELQKTWRVYSEDALEKLDVAVVGPVFVSLDDSLVPAATTPEPTEPSTPTVTPSAPTPTPTPTPTLTPTPSPESTEPIVIVQDGSSSWEDDGGSSSSWEDDASSSSSSGSGSFNGSTANETIQFPVGAVALRAANHKEKLVATIVASGNSSELLHMLEVEAIDKDEKDGVRVHLKNKDGEAEGFVLTQIKLFEKNMLRQLSTSVASSVDVASGVVLNMNTEQKLKIETAGSANVYITEKEPLTVEDVDIDASGSGQVQIVASSVQVDGKISFSVSGSGALAIHADAINTTQIKSTVSGTGALYVMSKDLSAYEFSTSVYGASFASFHASQNGSAYKHKLTIAGSGAVYAGSVVANRTNVDIWGKGVAYVQVTDKLKSSASYSGEVYYVGAKPLVVKTSGWFFWRSSVRQADSDKYEAHEVVSSPPVYPAYVAVVLVETRHSDGPIIKVLDTPALPQHLSLAGLTTHLTKVAHGPNGLLIFGGVAAGLVAAALVAHSYQQHRVRRQYMPLV